MRKTVQKYNIFSECTKKSTFCIVNITKHRKKYPNCSRKEELFILLYLISYIVTELNSALDEGSLFLSLGLFLCRSSRLSNYLNCCRSSLFSLSFLSLFVCAAECSKCNSYKNH